MKTGKSCKTIWAKHFAVTHISTVYIPFRKFNEFPLKFHRWLQQPGLPKISEKEVINDMEEHWTG
jgi:hypothetical protein